MLEQEMEERNDSLNVYLVINLSQSNKSQYQWMLHLDFIDQNIFTSRIDVRIEQQWSRNGAEEKHIEEDEEHKEKLKPFRNLKC